MKNLAIEHHNPKLLSTGTLLSILAMVEHTIALGELSPSSLIYLARVRAELRKRNRLAVDRCHGNN